MLSNVLAISSSATQIYLCTIVLTLFQRPKSSVVQESLRKMVFASQCLRTDVQKSNQDMSSYTEQVISSARDVVKAAQALAASIEQK